MIGFKYGAFLMQNPEGGVVVTFTDVFSAPANDVQIDTLAEADGGLVVKQQFKPKTFTVNGYLRAADRATLRDLRDTFKTAMSQRNQAFDVEDAGELRRYLANAQNVALSDNGLTSVGFSVQFVSADGMGWNVESTDLLVSTPFTTGAFSLTAPIEGSYQAEPTLIVTYSAVSGATSKSVTISNGATLRGIKVTRTWANGDVLEFNSLKKVLYINNQPHDYEGQFPIWNAGETAVVNYLDDFTSRSGTIRGFYTPRWL